MGNKLNMKELIFLFLFITNPWVHGSKVHDENRDCPSGFLYAGEVPEVTTRGEIWQKGETSPVYSCYNMQEEDMDWVTANQRCFEDKGQLLSVNNDHEDVMETHFEAGYCQRKRVHCFDIRDKFSEGQLDL